MSDDTQDEERPYSLFETSIETETPDYVLRAMYRSGELEVFKHRGRIWIRPAEVERLKRLKRGLAA